MSGEYTAELSERIFGAAIAAADLAQIYLGERLGLWSALGEEGSANSKEVAAATGTNERYCREWLESMCAGGLLTVDDAQASADDRRYALKPGSEPVLLDQDAPEYLAWVPRMFTSAFGKLPELLEAFRSGGGVPWSSYGPDMIEAQGTQNRTLFLTHIAQEWFPQIADVHKRLQQPARVADIACGTGWSSIAFAKGYPSVTVDGYDLDQSSIEIARSNAAEHGVADRVTFKIADATDGSLDGSYDLVTIFEALHDMGRPVEALRAAKRLVGEHGAVVVCDEKTEDRFTPDAPDLERLFQSFSVLICLPTGLADGPDATGTMMRPATIAALAQEAGFPGAQPLKIETDMFRFYRLQ